MQKIMCVARVCVLAVLVLTVSAYRGPATTFRGFTAVRRYSSVVEYTDHWAVEVVGGITVANRVASKHGFINHGQIGRLDALYNFQMNTSLHEIVSRSVTAVGAHPGLTAALQQEELVTFTEQQQIHSRKKRDYTTPTDPDWQQQWALLNRDAAGKDLNVEPVWMQGITGHGVVVSFVDDGLEKRHPDLARNYDSLASWDFVHHDSDPTPDSYYGDEPDSHGTECAGEVGMVRDNGHCGVGVAYDAHIGGLKMDLARATDLTEASALGYHDNHIQVYSNSWGPSDFGFEVDGPGGMTARTLQNGVAQGRNNRGVVYVWSAGNGGSYYDSCAADGYVSSIYTLAVGSVDRTGLQADYDEECASKMAVTFSYNSRTFPSEDDSWSPYNQMRTTTLNGRCTDEFTGTSASAPLMAGVVALVLQANPLLSWRDIQYLVAYTANRELLQDGDWATNGGGLRVSHKFGFGVIDAETMVTRARRWTNVPSQHSHTVHASQTTGTVRQHHPLNVTFDVTTDGGISFLEHVIVKISLSVNGYSVGFGYEDFDLQLSIASNVDELLSWLEHPHPRRGDINIQLTSPHGTVSHLLPYRRYDFINEEGYSNWPFMSVHHWGESPQGRWTLSLFFKSSTGYVNMNSATMTIYGTALAPEAVSSIPSHCDESCAGAGCSGTGADHCDSCQQLRVSTTLECVSTCPSGTHLHKNYCLGPPNITPDQESTTPITHHNATLVSHTLITSAMTPTGQSSSEKPDSNDGKQQHIPIVIGSSVAAVTVLLLIVSVVMIVGVVCYHKKNHHSRLRFIRLKEDTSDPIAV